MKQVILLLGKLWRHSGRVKLLGETKANIANLVTIISNYLDWSSSLICEFFSLSPSRFKEQVLKRKKSVRVLNFRSKFHSFPQSVFHGW